MSDLAFLTLFFLPMFISWGRVYVCALTWGWIAILTPNFFMRGFASSIPYNKLSAGVTFIALLISKEKKQFRKDSTSIFVVLFLIQMVVAQATSLTAFNAGWDIVDKFWKIAAFYFLVLSFCTTPARIHAMVIATCLGIDFDASAAGLKFFTSGGTFHSYGSPSWGDNNHEAMIILMGIPLLTYVRAVSINRLMRIAALVGITLSVFAVVASPSRGGLIGLIICAAFGILRSRRKVPYLIAVAIFGMVILYFAGSRYTERMNTIQTAAEEDDSFIGRVRAWKISILMALDNPMTGGGLHSVAVGSVYDRYARDFDRLSFIYTPGSPGVAHAAHSIYFEVLGDTGFLGLGLFLCIILSSLLRTWRCSALAKKFPELRWAYLLSGQLQISVMVYIVTGSALSAGYYDIPYLTFSLVSAVSMFVKQHVAEVKRAAAGPLKPATPASGRPLARPLPPGPGIGAQPAGVPGRRNAW